MCLERHNNNYYFTTRGMIKFMKIILINPATQRYTRTPCTPLGILSIATYLEANGHNVKVLNRTIKSTDIKKEFDEFMPDVIGCSLISTMSFKDAIEVSKEAKSRGICVVWGGPFVSSSPEISLETGCVDFVSIGEGEETWLKLVNALRDGIDIHGIKGIAYLKNGKFIKNPEREFMDLSTLPPINYEYIDLKPILYKNYDYTGVFGMYISKGCTGHCTFCYNTDFHKNCRRQRPVKYLIQEAKYLKEKHNIGAISFTDEFFGCNKDILRQTCQAFIDEKLDLPWGCMTKIGIFDKEDYQLMYDSGCRWIEFGIESGSPSMLKRIKKGMNVERVLPDLKICKEIGIITLCYFIVGLPGETQQELKETCELVNKISFTRFICSYYNPLPGSEIFNQLVSEGKFTPPKSIKDYMKTRIFYSPKPNLSNVPTKDLKVVRSYMLWKSFTKKHYAENEKFSYATARKDIEDVFESLKGHGFKAGFEQLLISGYEFLDIFFYANFFPKTRKKYGLKL